MIPSRSTSTPRLVIIHVVVINRTIDRALDRVAKVRGFAEIDFALLRLQFC
jgi:hypothetical protein